MIRNSTLSTGIILFTGYQEVENNVSCVAQLFARRQHKLSTKKDTIAQLACAILENPEQKVTLLCIMGLI